MEIKYKNNHVYFKLEFEKNNKGKRVDTEDTLYIDKISELKLFLSEPHYVKALVSGEGIEILLNEKTEPIFKNSFDYIKVKHMVEKGKYPSKIKGDYALVIMPKSGIIRLVKREGREYNSKYYICVPDEIAQTFKKWSNNRNVIYRSKGDKYHSFKLFMENAYSHIHSTYQEKLECLKRRLSN